MKKLMILSAPEFCFEALQLQVKKLVQIPLLRLTAYYASVLERELTPRHTWLLIHAQVAFVCMAYAVNLSFCARTACCVWFAWTLLQCRKAF